MKGALYKYDNKLEALLTQTTGTARRHCTAAMGGGVQTTITSSTVQTAITSREHCANHSQGEGIANAITA